MTEDEAKTKWCPMARSSCYEFSVNRPVNEEVMCIGSACMMWRKDLMPNPAYRPYELVLHSPAIPAHIQSETDGHCGLAGGV